jgi:hypothetical protein
MHLSCAWLLPTCQPPALAQTWPFLDMQIPSSIHLSYYYPRGTTQERTWSSHGAGYYPRCPAGWSSWRGFSRPSAWGQRPETFRCAHSPAPPAGTLKGNSRRSYSGKKSSNQKVGVICDLLQHGLQCNSTAKWVAVVVHKWPLLLVLLARLLQLSTWLLSVPLWRRSLRPDQKLKPTDTQQRQLGKKIRV